MRDWCNEVSRKLANSRLPVEEREEISRELAGHLEDLYSDARNRGLDESAAIKCAVAELDEDARLGPKLHLARQEGNMMIERIKRFWFPSIAILFASVAFLVAIQAAGLRPHFMMKGELPLVIYLPWLIALPFLGAGGAYWARCQRGGQTVAAAIGLIPVLKFFGSFAAAFIASSLVALPVCVALGALTPDAKFFIVAAGAVLSWVVIPGAALLLGVLPFLPASRAPRRLPS
ncbi:MAG: permease prefix domain 1-containing protein [Candidatus Acidiferrales bacterium]